MTRFIIGRQVKNFGVIATVIGFHSITGDLILEAAGIGKWIADPAKCEPAPAPVRYKDGLVILG